MKSAEQEQRVPATSDSASEPSAKNQQGPGDPYSIAPPPPPVRPRTKQSLVAGIVIGIIIASLLFLGGSRIFMLLAPKAGNPTPVTSAPSAAATQSMPVTPSDSSLACPNGFSDEFNISLHPGWNWVDPSRHATYYVSAPGLLTLTTSDHSDLNAATNDDAPRLLQPIAGNFTLNTIIELPQKQKGAFQAAGILIWQDQNNFLRLERNQDTIDFEQEVNGVFSHDAPGELAGANISASQIELQIQRNGDAFSAFWRTPDQSWNYINTAKVHLQNIQVGLDLLNQGLPQVTANYHHFRVTCP